MEGLLARLYAASEGTTDGIRGPTTDGFKWLDGTLILKAPGWQGAVDKSRDTRNRMGAFLSEKGQLITSHQGEGESRAGSQREVLSVPQAQTEHSGRAQYKYKGCRDVIERAMTQM